MGSASLGGWRFRLDPSQVSMPYRVRVAVRETLGGRVVQVLGAETSDLTVLGSYGKGKHREQAAFLRWFRDEAVAQRDDPTRSPLRFRFPMLDLNVRVRLRGLTQDDADLAVRQHPGVVAPGFRLTLAVVDDDPALTRIAMDAYIDRLVKGFGWKQTAYNGPLDDQVLKDVLQGKSLQEYLALSYNPAVTALASVSGALGADTTSGSGAVTGSGSFIIPVPGPKTSGFGNRVHPISGSVRLHAGVDLDGETGDPVRAAANGTVTSYTGSRGGYGNVIELDHGGGVTTRYAHLSRINVQVGSAASQGQVIGLMGSTGNSTGAHLHFEVRENGKAVNPEGTAYLGPL